MEDFSRRRRVREDDEEEADVKRVRGPDGNDILDIGPKLINMISRVDENIKGTLEDTLEELASTLKEILDPYEGQIISILSECAMYLPEKLTMFTTLAGILNSKSSEFGANMINKLMSDFNDSFSQENYDIALRLSTFICDLGNACVIDLDSIVHFLNSFANLTVVESVQADFFAYTVMHALPWIGPQLQESKPNELNQLLVRLGEYVEKRNKKFIQMIQVWSKSEHSQKDYIDCLWIQIEKLKKDKWLEHHISRLYVNFKEILNQDSVVRHSLPQIDLDVIQSMQNFPLPKIVFRLFDYNDIPTSVEQPLPPDTSIERFLLEEDLNWIIDNNYLEWHGCAKALLNYHRQEAVPLDYCVIEVIFGQLFSLPRSIHLEIFYGALLIELCRIKPDTMPQVLAQAAELLYQRADTMQQVCLDRFVDWFSYHLSNFQYRWSWSDWADCLKADSLHPRRIFVHEVIEKCMRLAYHKKVAEFLPSDFSDIIPPEPVIIYILDDESHELKHYAQDFQDLINQKRPSEEFIDLLQKIDDKQLTTFDPDMVGVFTAVLLKMASATFSHTFAALAKYHKIFKEVVKENSEEMQSVILRTLFNCWKNNKQMMSILVDKLLKMQIIDPSVVQAWIFSDEMKREFKRSWVWDILNNAISRLESHCAKLVNEHEKLVGMIEEVKNNTDMELDEMADKDDEELKTELNSRPKIIAPETQLADLSMDVDNVLMGKDIKENNKYSLGDLEKKLVENRASSEDVEESLKNILLNTSHKFALILTEHLLNCENDGTDIETEFYNYVLGRFRHIFLMHADSMWKYADILDRELFAKPTIETRIREIFIQFTSLKK